MYGDLAGGNPGVEVCIDCPVQGPFFNDNRFTQFDVQIMLQLTALQTTNASLFDAAFKGLCPWSKTQLNPDLRPNEGTTRDASYLKLVLLEKRRFLVEYGSDSSAVGSGTTGDVLITVRLLNSESQPADPATVGVRMELGDSGAATPALASTGAISGSTPIGNTMTTAESVGEGYWRVAMHPLLGWGALPIGVAVLVETLDASSPPRGYAQNGDYKHNYAFLGSSDEAYVELAGVGSTTDFQPLFYFPSSPPFCQDAHAYQLVEHAVADLDLRGDSVGFPVVGSESSFRDERERRFGFLRAHPPAQAALSGTLEGSTAYSTYVTSGGAYSMARPRATLVSAVVRTPFVGGVQTVSAFRSTVAVAYQVSDAYGNTDVDKSLVVSAEFQHEDGVMTTTGSCSWVFSTGGIGECAVALSDAWFASPGLASVTVSISYDGVSVASSMTHMVALQEKLFHPLLDEAGMVATMPTGPVCAGERFTVEVRAHTGAVAVAELTAWQLTISFDANVLEFLDYYMIESGSCGDFLISTKSECEAAATALDLSDQIAADYTSRTHSSYPPGCQLHGPSSLYVWGGGSTGSCSSSKKCMQVSLQLFLHAHHRTGPRGVGRQHGKCHLRDRV